MLEYIKEQMRLLRGHEASEKGQNKPTNLVARLPHLGHKWKQYDKYYNTSRGVDAVILCDRCERCGRMSKLVGGGGLLWPQRIYDDD